MQAISPGFPGGYLSSGHGGILVRMTIDVVDHCGVTIGRATIAWDGDLGSKRVLIRQASEVLAAETQLVLPTKDERCPWKLVIRR